MCKVQCILYDTILYSNNFKINFYIILFLKIHLAQNVVPQFGHDVSTANH